MAKKRSFKKLREHLTSNDVDKKIEYLESRMPTNNTALVFQGDPSNPQGNSFETIVDGEENETDYTVGENPSNSTEARDTTGLFNVGGDHSKGEFVKTVEPPGDTSYVLGPMAAMYYTWSYPWTMVGYIRESDRRMVNLGRIDGKLSDWDGSVGNAYSGTGTFYSYGQLTTEQALWFRDIQKANGNTNDPDTYSYRAFYPGPPSQAADAFGRYPCVMTGVSKQIPRTLSNVTPLGAQAGDNFSAQNARNKRGSGMDSRDGKNFFGDLASFGRNIFNRATKGLGDFLQFGLGGSDWMVKGLKGTSFSDFKFDKDAFTSFKGSGPNVTDPRWIDQQAGKIFKGRKLADFADDLVSGATGGRWNPKFFQKLAGKNYVGQYFADGNNFKQAIDYAQDGVVVATEKIKSAPGWKNWFGGAASRSVKGEPEIFVRGADLAKNKTFKVFDSSTEAGRKAIQNLATKTTKSSKALKFAGRAVPFVGAVASGYDAYDRFQKGDAFGGVLSVASMMPGPVGWWALGAQVAYDIEGAVNKDGFKGTVTGSRFKVEGYLVEGVDSDTQVIPDIAKQGMYDHLMEQGVPLNDPEEYSKEMIAALSLEDVNPELIQIILAAINREEYDKDDIEDIKRSMTALSINLIAHRKKMMKGKDVEEDEVKEGISLERKREIFGHLTKPVVLPETKQKTYKVSPGQRFKNKNKKSEGSDSPDMSKLFSKNIEGPQPFKPQERTSWTKDFIAQNVMKSQEKMNGVLEMIGDGNFALQHAMNDYKRMSAKELEQYWGKNPNMYSFLFNGKKYNVTRKEHIEGDLVVFMQDQDGVKTNMLQSELNEKLEKQNEKWINEAYFKAHPVIPQKKESTYDMIRKRFLENREIAPEFPKKAPPKMVNGFHPDYGKRADRYKKLDPASANAMPETGDPETDEIVRKQKTINKIKSMRKK